LLAFGASLHGQHREDPMNADLRFDRAYLRLKLWPTIAARWPGAQLALSRAARHAAQAQELLDETAALDVSRLRDGDALLVPTLRALPPLRRFNAVRLWLADFGVEPPSTARLQEALRQVLEAKSDQMPQIVWGEHALRRYRQRLFLTAAASVRLETPLEWRIGCAHQLDLGPGLGSLRWSRHKGGIDARHQGQPVLVRGRVGGETLKIAAGAKTHTLQHLCQEFGVLPWMRAALPLLFMGDALLGVADLWLETRWCAADALGFAPDWIDAPIIG
jgi:tRNA(Ile)-lysidine synthase